MWLLDKLIDHKTSGQVNLRANRGRITLVIGNGLSQSAAYLARNLPGAKQNVGWWKAVAEAAVRFGVPINQKDLAKVNPLAIMEAIVRRGGRDELMNYFRAEFADVQPSGTHALLKKLKPRHIVTTNYDDLLEKEFSDARVLVRDFNAPDDDAAVTIHKIHGTLTPRNQKEEPVISESDYDNCLQEMKDSKEKHPDAALWRALSGPILVIGKGVYWHDLSFLYALRITRDREGSAYWVSTSLPPDVSLHLDNVNIAPLTVQLPTNPNNGHYYAGVGLALARLLQDISEEGAFLDFISEKNLERAPTYLAIGIAAHNTVGYVGHPNSAEDKRIADVTTGEPKTFVVTFPIAGRRNRTFHAEEFPGGSALTALGTFSALAKADSDSNCSLTRSIISVVDGADPFSASILKLCTTLDIDTDGLSLAGEQTWHSTVILHDIESKDDGPIHEGVRFFFDRRIRRLNPDNNAADQLRAQLSSPKLRLVYMDKFLAQPGEGSAGFLVQHKSAFEPLLNRRVDVVYETGGAGSPNTFVENEFADYFTVITSSFPFFARYILTRDERMVGGDDPFSHEWWNIEFLVERQVLDQCVSGFKGDDSFAVPQHWCERAAVFLRRANGPRRWFVTTMHEHGALGFDLNSGQGLFVRAEPEGRIVNTSGAGDVFRGAFCYELLNCDEQCAPNAPNVLANCLKRAVKVATLKCSTFSHAAFLNSIAKAELFRHTGIH